MSLRFIFHIYIILVVTGFNSCNTSAEDAWIANDLILQKIDHKMYFYPEQGANILDSLIRTFTDTEKEMFTGYKHFLEGHYQYQIGNFDSSIVITEHAIDIFTKSENLKWLAKCNLVLGRIAQNEGYWDLAKIHYFKTLNLLQDEICKETAFAHAGIYQCKKLLKEPYQSDFEKCVSRLNYEKDSTIQLYKTLLFLSENDSSNIEGLKKLLHSYASLGLMKETIGVCKSIASAYKNNLELDSAMSFIQKGLNLHNEYLGDTNEGLTFLEGEIYLLKKEWGKAEQLFLNTLKINETNQHYDLNSKAYDGLFQVEQGRNNHAKALDYFIQSIDAKNKTRRLADQRVSAISEGIYQIERLKLETIRLKKLEFQSAIKWSLIILFCLAFFIVVYISIRIKYQKKRTLLNERNSELQQLIIGIEEKRFIENKLGKIKTEVSLDFNSLKFAENFEACYSETIKELSNAYPQLSTNELRYSVMFAMDLKLELIADLQQVNVSSIRKTRQRIRTKLNLDSSVNLTSFLQEFTKQGSQILR